MQSKATVRDHYTPTSMDTMKKVEDAKDIGTCIWLVGQEIGKTSLENHFSSIC